MSLLFNSPASAPNSWLQQPSRRAACHDSVIYSSVSHTNSTSAVLTSCFSSWSLFPHFLCCLSLISIRLLPLASSDTVAHSHNTRLLLLKEFLSSVSYRLMQYNWTSISNPLPFRIFHNLLIRMPQFWPGWSSEIAVQFCCWKILTLETSNASVFCIIRKFVFLVWLVKNRPGNGGLA